MWAAWAFIAAGFGLWGSYAIVGLWLLVVEWRLRRQD